ncbi:MAG: surface lipoprotein assembly modifier [Rhodobacteraceae bacterium]|nr:surface lipoprotein assembly modifier [Paracoccaceae bacterium]
MKPQPYTFKRFILIALCWCLLGLQNEALGQSKPTITNEYLQYAQELLAANQFEVTLQILQEHNFSQEQKNQYLFLLGLASVELSLRTDDEEIQKDLLNQAVESFRKILIDEPSLIRVRLELARAFFLQNKDILAKEQFERVLASNPPPAVQSNINGFLNTMYNRRRLSGSLNIQMVRETNINSGTNDKIIWFNSLPFTRSGADPKAATGMMTIGRGNYRHPLSETVDLLSELSLSRTEFSGSDYDRTVIDFYTGPVYRLNERTSVGLQGYIISDINKNSPNRKLGGQVRIQHLLDIKTKLGVQLNFGKRTYTLSERAINNANEYELGLSLNHRLSSTLTLNSGITFARSHVKYNPNLENRSFQWNAGISSLLNSGLTVGFGVSNSRKTYQGQPGFPTRDGLPQKDKLLTLQATFLHRDLTFWGFSPQLVLINEKFQSNAQASDFNNNRAQVVMVRQF